MKTTAESPSDESFNNSYIGVYCRRKTPNEERRMKRRYYLSVIGRQSQVDCHKHKCPLILNQFPKGTHENSSYRCICRNAEKTVMRDTIAGATAHISAHSITKIFGLPFVMSL